MYVLGETTRMIQLKSLTILLCIWRSERHDLIIRIRDDDDSSVHPLLIPCSCFGWLQFSDIEASEAPLAE